MRARILRSVPASGQVAVSPGYLAPSADHTESREDICPCASGRLRSLACLESPYLQRIQPGSRAPWPGPASRLSPTTLMAPGPSGLRLSGKPGPGGAWVMTLRKALPLRPARGASPRAVRPALPAAAPGAERNQWVHQARTTPRALGVAAKFYWLGAPGGCGLGHSGRGYHGVQQTKTVLLGPARAARGRGCAVGTQRPGAGNLLTALCEGQGSPCFGTWGPSRCLDAARLLNLFVLASVTGTLWRAHVERLDSLRPAGLDAASCESSRMASHLERPPRPRVSLSERAGSLSSEHAPTGPETWI